MKQKDIDYRLKRSGSLLHGVAKTGSILGEMNQLIVTKPISILEVPVLDGLRQWGVAWMEIVSWESTILLGIYGNG